MYYSILCCAILSYAVLFNTYYLINQTHNDCPAARKKASIGFDEVVPYIRIDHITDIFTKAFHPANFHRLLSKLGLLDIHRPHLEGVGQDIYVKSQ